MDFLGEFEFETNNIKGKENKIADALNRNVNSLMEISVSSIKTNFSIHIRILAQKDEDCVKVKKKLQ